MAEKFGQFFKRMRIASGQTLRGFCLANKFDAGNTSKIERGRAVPPDSTEVLERYAMALKIAKDSEEWQIFLDLAAAERGRIPSDLLNDEELVQALPVLYRTLRGTPVDGESLDDLIDKIRKA